MIKVTVWNEHVQERGLAAIPNYEQLPMDIQEHFQKSAIEIKKVHPNGIHNTLKGILEEDEEFVVRTVTMDMPECGLTEEQAQLRLEKGWGNTAPVSAGRTEQEIIAAPSSNAASARDMVRCFMVSRSFLI